MQSTSPGELKKEGENYIVRFERLFSHDINAVWSAITDPEKMAIWFTDIEMDFAEGGKMIIYFKDADRTKTYGRVIRIETGKVFEFAWENEDGPDEIATWELFPAANNSCRLVFTYKRQFDQYAKTVPAGWHILLDQLAEMLKGRTEPYPFGSGETDEGRTIKSFYTQLWNNTFES